MRCLNFITNKKRKKVNLVLYSCHIWVWFMFEKMMGDFDKWGQIIPIKVEEINK